MPSVSTKIALDAADFTGAYNNLVNAVASVTNGLTAKAGGGQSGATALPSAINRVTTVATAGDSVVLPAATAGNTVVVINAAATNSLNVFAASGDTMTATLNGSSAVAAGKASRFFCAVNGTWNVLAGA